MSFRKRAYIIALAFVCSTTLFFPTDIYANSVNIGTSDSGIGTSNTENDLSVKINAKVITSVNGAVKHLKIEMPSDELLFGFKLTINYDSSALELIGDATSKLLSDENIQDDGVIISTGTNYNLVEECNYILEADFRVLNQDYEDFSINFDEFYEVVGVQEFETRDVSLNTIYETEKDYILGDVNLDGKVNVMDTVAILQYSQGQIQHFGKASTKEYDLNHDGLEKTLEDDLWVADTNTDGTINVMDAVAILQYSSGTITELSRKETIISKILDVNGNPLADVKVNVINNDTNKLIKTATSDENGDFNLGLKEGDYTLTFSKDDYITIIKSVIIDGYDNTPPLDDTIIMNIGNNIETALIGSVLDINDNLISGATVDIQKDNEVISSTTTDENGTFEIALYSGVYSLVVSKDGYQTNTIKIILDGSNESITLEPIVLNEIIQDDTGSCGENATYSFDSQTGTLTIKGTGDMQHFIEGKNCSDTPWFNYTDYIKEIVIEEGITSISNDAFAWCVNLEKVTLPTTLNMIDYQAFYCCEKLENISIPDSVNSIGDMAFLGTPFLENQTDDFIIFGSVLYKYQGNDTSVIIPNNITSIGYDAFSDCTSLESITIPNSVTSINDYAFYDCTSLTDVYFQGTKEQWNTITIASYGNELLTNATIHFEKEPTTITGKVVDTEGNPISNVNIKVDLDTVTSTDENGEFSFDILNGEYTLSFEKNGYVTFSKSVSIDSNDETSPLDDTIIMDKEVIGTAYLCYSGAVQQWDIGDLGGSYATITGNGDYTASIDFAEDQGSEKIELLFIQSDINIYEEDAKGNKLYDDMVFTINSIIVDGKEIEYTGPSDEAESTGNEGTNYRFNILNTWGNNVQDIDPNIEHTNNITVNFSVSGIKSPENDYSGSCGENATYSFDKSTGALTISGTGDMEDYSYNLEETPVPWYDYMESIKSVVIEDGIISIGDWAFFSCTSLESVTIPDSVTSIGEGVFYVCTSLTDVTIPNSVTYISSNAFYETPFLENKTDDFIILGNGILYEYQGDDTSITIPDTVKSIGDCAFWNCTSLTDITIPEGVTSIGGFAFYSCTSLESITIPNSVTSISSATFSRCTSLKEITIPNSVTSIGWNAFENCTNLTDVYFNGTEDEWNAITINDSNDLLTNATIHFEEEIKTPEVQTILDTAELTPHDTIYCYDCSSDMNSTDIMYTYKINDNDKQILQNFIDENFTDDMCNTEKIKYTMDWLHNNITYTLSEDYGTLSNSLAECGFVQNAGQCLQYNGALAYMLAYMGYDTNLIFLKKDTGWQHFTCQVRIDGKVYRMEVGNKGLDDGSHYMYQTFLKLEPDVNVDDNTIIGECGESATYSFDKSTGVLTISGVGDMSYSSPIDNDWEFYNYDTDETVDFSKDIKSVIIEDGITSIGLGTFSDCTSLESVTLPDSLLDIGGFYNCTSLKNITIPDNVTHIMDYAFSGCTSLKSIVIPDNVTYIGFSAFWNCTALESVTIPSSVTFIAPDAFDETLFLENQTDDFIIFGNGILYKYQGNETEVTIPNNVTIIEGGAFANNENLISVTIPDSVTGFNTVYYEYGAFSGCTSLERITIPNSVTSIDADTFYGCDNLKDVYFQGTKDEWNAIEIADENDPLTNATIHFKEETTNITGKVLDTEGNPISNVNIKVDLDTITSTDENGEFSFDILNGEYTLSFEKDGYKTTSQSLEVNSDSNLSLDSVTLEVIPTINGIPEDEYYQKVNEVIALVNEYRKANGLSEMYTSSVMNELAQQRAKEQETTGLSHTRPDGSSCFTIFGENGLSYSSVAENVAYGSSTAEGVMEQWKNSSGHNANILGNYDYIGVGVTYYNNVYYWVQIFCCTSNQEITSNAIVITIDSKTT